MEPQPNDLKAIRILYLAMLGGQLAFALIVIALVASGILSTANHSLTSTMQVAVIVIAIGALAASYYLLRKRLSDINPEEGLSKKLEKYRAALILSMALCEMPTLFATIAYFLTHDHFFLWMVALLIINFLFMYPTRDKIVNHLQLNSSEQLALGLD